jgi:hypothetical protein
LFFEKYRWPLAIAHIGFLFSGLAGVRGLAFFGSSSIRFFPQEFCL